MIPDGIKPFGTEAFIHDLTFGQEMILPPAEHTEMILVAGVFDMFEIAFRVIGNHDIHRNTFVKRR